MVKFKVEAMNCGHCVRAVQGVLSKLASEGAIKIDLARQEVSVTADLDPALAIAAMKAAGYDAAVI